MRGRYIKRLFREGPLFKRKRLFNRTEKSRILLLTHTLDQKKKRDIRSFECRVLNKSKQTKGVKTKTLKR